VFLSWGEGYYPPPTESNTTPPSPKTEITNILFYIYEICSGGPIIPACDDATRVKRRLLFDRVGVFMADIIFTPLSLRLNERKRNANTYFINLKFL